MPQGGATYVLVLRQS